MNITKNSVAEVASQLSPWAVKIITTFNADLHFGQEDFFQYYKGVLELIGRNAIRSAYDLIRGHWILVLQPGGKLLQKHFQAVKGPKA